MVQFHHGTLLVHLFDLRVKNIEVTISQKHQLEDVLFTNFVTPSK